MIPARLHLVIANKRTLIVEMVVSEIRVFRLVPAHVSNADIGQNIEPYLTAVIDALAHGTRRGDGASPRAPEVVRIAVEHAQRRARIGWDVRSLLTEFGILRSTIVEVASQAGTIPIEEWERLADVMHESMVEAAASLSDGATRSNAVKTALSTQTFEVQARGSSR